MWLFLTLFSNGSISVHEFMHALKIYFTKQTTSSPSPHVNEEHENIIVPIMQNMGCLIPLPDMQEAKYCRTFKPEVSSKLFFLKKNYLSCEKTGCFITLMEEYKPTLVVYIYFSNTLQKQANFPTFSMQ